MRTHTDRLRDGAAGPYSLQNQDGVVTICLPFSQSLLGPPGSVDTSLLNTNSCVAQCGATVVKALGPWEVLLINRNWLLMMSRLI